MAYSRLIQSFSFAFRGLWHVAREEMSFRVQVLAAFAVVVLMIVFPVSRIEILLLIFVICTVLILEIINTVLERLVDIYKPRLDPYARDVKDMMAAAVLLASVGALIIGLIIFVPHIRALWQ